MINSQWTKRSTRDDAYSLLEALVFFPDVFLSQKNVNRHKILQHHCLLCLRLGQLCEFTLSPLWFASCASGSKVAHCASGGLAHTIAASVFHSTKLTSIKNTLIRTQQAKEDTNFGVGVSTSRGFL